MVYIIFMLINPFTDHLGPEDGGIGILEKTIRVEIIMKKFSDGLCNMLASTLSSKGMMSGLGPCQENAPHHTTPSQSHQNPTFKPPFTQVFTLFCWFRHNHQKNGFTFLQQSSRQLEESMSRHIRAVLVARGGPNH